MTRGTRLMVVATVAVVGLLGLDPPIHAQDKADEAAAKSAETWLALVDQGKYAESWEAAATLFKAAVSQEKWTSAVSGARAPFGKLVSRTVKATQFTKILPGAPDGQYVVVQFTSSFENKKDATETVTPMLEADGSWKVSGYYIR